MSLSLVLVVYVWVWLWLSGGLVGKVPTRLSVWLRVGALFIFILLSLYHYPNISLCLMLFLYYFLGPHFILAFYLFFPTTFSLLIITLSLKSFNNFLILFIFIIWLYTYTIYNQKKKKYYKNLDLWFDKWILHFTLERNYWCASFFLFGMGFDHVSLICRQIFFIC